MRLNHSGAFLLATLLVYNMLTATQQARGSEPQQLLPAGEPVKLSGAAHTTPASSSQPAPESRLAEGSPDDIRTSDDLGKWSTFYYLHPRPELTVKALHYAAKTGMFDQPHTTAIMFTLMTQLFAQNPQLLPSWIAQLSSLSIRNKALVWRSLRQVNTAESQQLANSLRQQFPADSRPLLLAQNNPPPQAIEKMDLSPPVLDMLWISFFITGDEKYVERIMSALTLWSPDQHDANKLITAGAAQWSLTSNARQHKRVMTICQSARKTQPQWKSQLDKVIDQAQAPPHN